MLNRVQGDNASMIKNKSIKRNAQKEKCARKRDSKIIIMKKDNITQMKNHIKHIEFNTFYTINIVFDGIFQYSLE